MTQNTWDVLRHGHWAINVYFALYITQTTTYHAWPNYMCTTPHVCTYKEYEMTSRVFSIFFIFFLKIMFFFLFTLNFQLVLKCIYYLRTDMAQDHSLWFIRFSGKSHKSIKFVTRTITNRVERMMFDNYNDSKSEPSTDFFCYTRNRN